MRADNESPRSAIRVPRLMVLLGLVSLLLGAAAAEAQYTSDFRVQDCTWTITGRGNVFFPLRANYQLTLEGDEDGTEIRNEITVTRTSKVLPLTVNGATRMVRTRVLEEREFEDGELVEVSRNYFVRCKETNDVYYFGEEVDDYEDGEIVGHEGAWQVGQGGAMPGIIMPGTFLLGSRYFQEVAPGVALDRGRNVAMSLDVETEAGEFSGCVAVLDSSAFEPAAEDLKVYCPGVGLVIDADFELIEYGVGVRD